MAKKHKLAICIPTYNRSEIIEKVLAEELLASKDKSVDIYIYDSSENSETEQIVNKFLSQGFDNLVLRKVDSSVHANEKVFMIYEEMEHSEYEYIWMIRDRSTINESTFQYVLSAIETNYPLYVAHVQNNDYASSLLYDLDQFLIECAKVLTEFGAAIVSVKNFLKGTNWNFYKQKYLNPKNISFSHMGYYLTRSAELKNFVACKLLIPRNGIKHDMTYGRSWESNKIQIVFEGWGDIILSLPSVYKQKKSAIQTMTLNLVGKYSLLYSRIKGNYGLFSFFRYRKWMKLVKPELYRFYMLSAILPIWAIKYLYLQDIIHPTKGNEELYIYGAGCLGRMCSDLLDGFNIKYDAYLVSAMEGNLAEINGHKVQVAKEVLCGQNATVIIAVSTQHDTFVAIKNYLFDLDKSYNVLNIVNFLTLESINKELPYG